MSEIRLIEDHDWDSIKTIYEEGIRTKNATFQTEAPTKEHWFTNHIPSCSIVYVLDGMVVGWAALSLISSRCVYAGVAEVSIYISERVRGQRIATALLGRLIDISEQNGFWTLQAGIFPENIPSMKLHLKHGFRELGRRERIGKLGDTWRDVMLVERRSRVVGID
ncbi:N-acetyltransferase [Paenibacillus rhizovicinus]|uniref:N-acetyltransferase n=1 Tax=Paenibacillus rhizovicinus TaxID=2704463 RepID=A0A6C0NU33_9BACL|nr:GNAT family N-acetyltransferase [Paenibacillus rhizovicinus]QHW29426.1 N-acetyltransferase [Paenibacillus rhizovicinus]